MEPSSSSRSPRLLRSAPLGWGARCREGQALESEDENAALLVLHAVPTEVEVADVGRPPVSPREDEVFGRLPAQFGDGLGLEGRCCGGVGQGMVVEVPGGWPHPGLPIESRLGSDHVKCGLRRSVVPEPRPDLLVEKSVFRLLAGS